MLVNPASEGQQVLAVVFLTSVDSSLPYLHLLTAFFCQLCPSMDCYLKLTVRFCPPSSTGSLLWDLLPPSTFSRVGDPMPRLCVGFVPKQTKRSSEWHQHKQKRIATYSVTSVKCFYESSYVLNQGLYFHTLPQTIHVLPWRGGSNEII